MATIECTYGPVIEEVGGVTYEFAPDQFGRFVAEVWIDKHIKVFVAVVDHYRLVNKDDTGPWVPPGSVAPGSVPILDYISPASSKLNPLIDLELFCYCDASLTYHADMWAMIDDKRYEYAGSWSQQVLTVIIPKADLAVSGVRQVRVCDANGESLPQPFTVEEALPFALSSYSPNPVPAGLTTGVTVMGSSFDATTEFYLDGGPFDPSWVVVNTSTRATLTAPSQWEEGEHVLTAYSDTLGQNSNELPLTVAAAAVPTLPPLTSLSPTTIPSGSTDWSVTVAGTGFVDGDTLYADDTALSTLFFSATSLNGTVPASLMTAETTLAITQRRGAETSPPLTLTVGPPLVAAVITSLNPATVVAGTLDTTLEVNGTDFVDGCEVKLANATRTTTFVSDTQLTTLIPASLMAASGTIAVKVYKPDVGNSNQVDILVTAAAARIGGGENDIPLTDIVGIGPALAQRLLGAEIADVRALARLNKKELAALDEELGLGGRSARDDWLGQAKKLAR